jgi:5,10-methylenetetrahydromethanopterin reductase
MGAFTAGTIGDRARQIEDDGWDGMRIADTQCIYHDAFVMMTTAVLATARLKFSFATSNPVTRHPAVAASAMAGIAELAGPRILYGIGRGDSALAYIGGAPASLDLFERYLAVVRSYLSGEEVPFDLIRDWRLSRDVATIKLSHAPEKSRLRYLKPGTTPIPIEVFATGPKVLAIGGRRGDRVALGLGGDIERLRWAIDIARAARAEAGLDPATLSFSSVVPTGVARDIDRARRSIANMVSSASRFAIINGSIVGPVSAAQREIFERIAKTYDMKNHGGTGEQTEVLTPEYIDSYAIVGPPDQCVERILQLIDLGIDALMLAPPQGDADPEDIRSGYELLVKEVIPAVRAVVAGRAPKTA